jgi:CHAD domain-containing protein
MASIGGMVADLARSRHGGWQTAAVPRLTVELELGDGDAAALPERIARRMRVAPGRPHTAERVLLDTFDARLRAQGLRAEWAARSAPRRELTLREPGVAARRASVADGPSIPVAALPPGPLRDRLAPVLGERALVPMARVRTRTLPLAVLNEDDKTVVRLALEEPAVLDGGTATALPPRLVVEPLRGYDREFDRALRRLCDRVGLGAAAAPLYDAAVTAAGGRPEGVSSKVRAGLEPGMRADVAAGLVLAGLADIAQANVAGAGEDLDPEFLHDLRVSIRRARTVLRELRGVHPAGDQAWVRAELRWAQALTGPVRDLDVQLGEWQALTGGTDGMEPLRELLLERRAHQRERLVRGLRGRRFAAMLRAWRALAATPPGAAAEPRAAAPIELVAGDRIRSVYRRMVRDGRAIGADSPPDALHDLRKRGKELRYLLELFGELFPARVVRPMVGALRDLQDVLGRHQDRAVQAAVLRDIAAVLASRPGGPEALLSAGVAVSALEAGQRLAREAFAERFAAFAAREQRDLVRRTFRKAPA